MANRHYDPIDLSSLGFWQSSPLERDTSFRILRDERPLSWHPPADGGLGAQTNDAGFWAVVRHEHVLEVSRKPQRFCSGHGVSFEDVPPEITDRIGSFLVTDAPVHTRLRKLISSAFTPRRVRAIEEQIRRQAGAIVADLPDGEEFDFVQRVSKRLPLWTISEMMGVPQSLRERVVEHADMVVGWNDPTILKGREPAPMLFEAIGVLNEVATELVCARRREGEDDLLTALGDAVVDGERLSDQEITAFFILLSVAGNDTTRHTTSFGALALCEFSDQLAYLVEDLKGRITPAVEEILRWATPVMTFRRTATQDCELGGQMIRAGEKVVMFYESANRDERVFRDPWRFNLARNPNPHATFGGGGVHFCLGASIARCQLRSIFSELLSRVAAIEFRKPEYLVSNFIQGVQKLPCRIKVR